MLFPVMMSNIETDIPCRPVNRSSFGIADSNHNKKSENDQKDTSSLDSGCDGHFQNGINKAESSDSCEIDLPGPEVICRRRRLPSNDDSESHEAELVRRRSASILEVKEHAHTRLKDELMRAQEELKLKDEECQKLTRVHDQMSEELEELTAKLFEEANNMVQDANVKRMNTEKLLSEAKAKIEVLQAEVTALKTLVITSTPSMPNKHLHPQLGSIVRVTSPEFVKGHRRSTSHHNLNKEMRSWDVPVTLAVETKSETEGLTEVDPVYFEEFHQWKQHPSLSQDGPFLSRVIKEDVDPCMAFSNSELAQKIFECVLNNTLTIEPIHERNPFPKKCSLTLAIRICKYRVKLADTDPYYSICLLARNRIAAVCDFITYIRYITQGLVKSDESGMYWEIVRLRKQMSLARLGFS